MAKYFVEYKEPGDDAWFAHQEAHLTFARAKELMEDLLHDCVETDLLTDDTRNFLKDAVPVVAAWEFFDEQPCVVACDGYEFRISREGTMRERLNAVLEMFEDNASHAQNVASVWRAAAEHVKKAIEGERT